MFTINRHQLCARRGTQRLHNGASCNETFFVGKTLPSNSVVELGSKIEI